LYTAKTISFPRSPVALSPDGKLAISPTKDGTVRVCDAWTGQVRRTLPGIGRTVVHGLDVSPDGKRLAIVSSPLVVIVDVESGEELDRIYGWAPAHFSPDGKHVATKVGNGVEIWEVGKNKGKASSSEPIRADKKMLGRNRCISFALDHTWTYLAVVDATR